MLLIIFVYVYSDVIGLKFRVAVQWIVLGQRKQLSFIVLMFCWLVQNEV